MSPHPDAIDPPAQDFATYGILHCAYVKRVARKGRKPFAVHAADGTYLGRFADYATAAAALRLQDMEPLRVH